MITKRRKQQYYKKRKQIKYFNIINIAKWWCESAVLLRFPSLTKVEVGNFPLLHFPRWLCLVREQLDMSLRHVEKSVQCKYQCFCHFDIQKWSVLSSVLLSPTQKFSLRRNLATSIAASLFSIFTKILKALQILLFIAFWRNVPRPS